MKRYFYARYCRYSANVIYRNSDGSEDTKPGVIYRFKSATERDDWVDSEVWDGNYCRSAENYRGIRHRLRRPHLWLSEEFTGTEYMVTY